MLKLTWRVEGFGVLGFTGSGFEVFRVWVA